MCGSSKKQSQDERQSFTFYLSFEKGIQALKNADQLLVYRAISRYSLFGEKPALRGFALMVWELILPTLEKSRKGFENGKLGAEFGKLGGAPKGNKNACKNNPQNNPQNNPTDTDTDTKRENNKRDANKSRPVSKRTAFVAPTLEELREYIAEKGLTDVDAERFIDYYTANGWKVGRTPMKDWRAAARNWNRKPMSNQNSTLPKNEARIQYQAL